MLVYAKKQKPVADLKQKKGPGPRRGPGPSHRLKDGSCLLSKELGSVIPLFVLAVTFSAACQDERATDHCNNHQCDDCSNS